MNRIVGWDIGGANLKSFSRWGSSPEANAAMETVFPMWQRPTDLADQLVNDASCLMSRRSRSQSSDRSREPVEWAVTMTGELADCFEDRCAGIRHIVNHVTDAADRLGVARVVFYGTDGRFVDADEARHHPEPLAAANWHALASAIAIHGCPNGLLVDIGSTTTDVIPLVGGAVGTDAKSDFDRLREQSLVYVGCRRTPVCALLGSANIGADHVTLMNEWFATIDDAMIWLKRAPESPGDCETADGRPRTRDDAARRLAKMIGCDRSDHGDAVWFHLSEQIVDAAIKPIVAAMTRWQSWITDQFDNATKSLSTDTTTLILSGHGHHMLPVDPDGFDNVMHLSEQIGQEANRAAPSWAVAELWSCV
ncbi:MAG: hydantoinase/oxoprolinase family protein [Planctomycetota bacterium]